MAVVLATTLRIGSVKDGKKTTKVVEEGTPYGKLTKTEKELAKELNLLTQVSDPDKDLDEEIDEADETKNEKAAAKDSETAGEKD